MHPAHESILALVSGLSPQTRGERRLCVLQAFIDDSKEDGDALILAGYIAPVEKWLQFSERWAQALTIRPPIKEFKMAQINIYGDEQYERVRYHYRLIEEFIGTGMVISVDIKAVNRISNEFGLPDDQKNPYYWAWIYMMGALKKHYSGDKKETIEVIFDEQTESKKIFQAWEIIKDEHNGNIAPFENDPMFRSSLKFMPLQAADLLAWWARMKRKKYGSVYKQIWPFPWSEGNPSPNYYWSEMGWYNIRSHIFHSSAKFNNHLFYWPALRNQFVSRYWQFGQ